MGYAEDWIVKHRQTRYGCTHELHQERVDGYVIGEGGESGSRRSDFGHNDNDDDQTESTFPSYSTNTPTTNIHLDN